MAKKKKKATKDIAKKLVELSKEFMELTGTDSIVVRVTPWIERIEVEIVDIDE